MATPGAKQSTPTPGQQALIEAMRLESARIYGQLQHEHSSTAPSTAVCTSVVADVPRPASNVTKLAPPRKDAA